MNPLEKTEFEDMKRNLNTLLRAITIEANTIVLQNPVIIRGVAQINGMTIFTGIGTPESNITANIGSIYLDLAGGGGTTLYVKESGTGNTGWSTTA